jgi:DNA-binding transcriptional MerR regulator/methanogenic corrinoid protein MtbC1
MSKVQARYIGRTMYTIRQAAKLSGVSEATLRAWERRYGVVSPRRTEAGYRVYDDASLAVVSTMRRLIDAGWAPREAGRAICEGEASALVAASTVPTPTANASSTGEQSDAVDWSRRFAASAGKMDMAAAEECLDAGFALGSFEHVIDTWLSPTLEALGDAWARGELDAAAEHAASHAVHRRLAAAFQAAGSRPRGPAVVVGLPPGSLHELGALAFATALRRLGHNVLYLGADVPLASWRTAVQAHGARAAVLAVPTPSDRPSAAEVADLLLSTDADLLVASGGASGQNLGPGVRTLPTTLAAAAPQLDNALHRDARN